MEKRKIATKITFLIFPHDGNDSPSFVIEQMEIDQTSRQQYSPNLFPAFLLMRRIESESSTSGVSVRGVQTHVSQAAGL